jgi:phosphopantothenoylcysteine synthetase/decarboxylase
MTESAPIAGPLSNRRVLVALSGGIACYKISTLVSRLVQSGADVTALMTDSATRFLGPITLESLTGRPVHTSQWEATGDHSAQHVGSARSADLMVIAPASANTIAKLAAGICDNVVTTVACALPRETPVLLAPAMNEQMWLHPTTARNVGTLQDLLGYEMIGPETGWQACRTQGAGRMSEPEQILERVLQILGD